MAANSVLAPFRSGRHDHGHCIEDALKAAETVCRDRGLRLTELRRQVLEMVWTEHRPVRAYDLLDRLRETRGRAAPPTIYRALDFLRDQGLVHRIESLNAYIGCGSPLSQHSGQFLICRECSAVAELDDPAIEKLIKKRANDAGFQVVGQTIEITGLCPQCSGGDESSSPGSENALSEHA